MQIANLFRVIFSSSIQSRHTTYKVVVRIFCRQIDKMDNESLKQIFRDLHSKITTSINPDSVIDALLSKNILCEDEYSVLRSVPDSRSRCRDLFALLYRSLHPETFVQLRLALLDQCPWIVHDIDEQLASATAQLHLGDSADGRLVSVNSS